MTSKLSEIYGQEHITSVLRAMRIRDRINNNIAIVGDTEIADQVFNAFYASLNCSDPVRGDACGECRNCRYLDDPTTWGSFLLPWRYDEREDPYKQGAWTLNVSYELRDGFLGFETKNSAGTIINPDILSLFIYAYQGTKADVLSATLKISRDMSYKEFIRSYIDVLTNILYLKNNIDVREIDKLDALRVLSVRVSAAALTSAIRVLWDAQNKTVLLPTASIEIASLLISEVLRPTSEPVSWDIIPGSSEKPIKVMDDNNLEQPLSIEEMLKLARS